MEVTGPAWTPLERHDPMNLFSPGFFPKGTVATGPPLELARKTPRTA